MAFSNISNLNLGDFLQIAFSAGVRNQISDDYRDWEQVKMFRVADPNGRETRFLFQNSYGPAAVQYRNPNFTAAFPTAQQITTAEHSAVFKELDVTIELEYNLWHRAQKSPAKYAEPLAMEIQSKTTAAKRRMAADFYSDGSGVVGKTASVVDTTGAGGSVAVTLDTSFFAHVGLFEYGDLLLAYEEDGNAATAPTIGGGGVFYAWRVKSKDRANDKVVLEPVDASGAVLNLTASNLANTDYFYRVGQPTFPDRTSVADWGSLTEVVPGLESLAASDGRVVHGITMSGQAASSTFDGGSTQLDVTMIQAAMDQAKINVGQSSYAWKKMCMAPEAQASLIESRETDRRFQTVEDNKRGIKFFAYVHGNDVLETYTSEYCPKSRIYMIPEARSGQGKVLEYHGTDFEPVRMGGMGEFHLKPSSSGGHERRIVSYMESLGTLICKHPAAIARITGFTL